jgi:hypothetical protein
MPPLRRVLTMLPGLLALSLYLVLTASPPATVDITGDLAPTGDSRCLDVASCESQR